MVWLRSWSSLLAVATVSVATGPVACTGGASTPECVEGASYDEEADACFCDPMHGGDPAVECVPHDDVCAEAEARVGHSACSHVIDDVAEWNKLSIGGGPVATGVRRLGKFMIPSGPESRLPTVFSDANYYRLHYCFMTQAFAPVFPGLTTADHAQIILSRSHREFFAGATYELEPGSAAPYGFSVETAGRPEEQLSVDEIYAVYRQLQDRFVPGELAYVPRGDLQVNAAAGWTDPPFVVSNAEDKTVSFETYTPGIAYGRVRLVTTDDAALGWQDIAVFDAVPGDHEGVLAAAITDERQDILSHLNVLSGQRGSPNIFVDDAMNLMRPYEGQLVRLEADVGSYKVVAVDEDEAQAHWEQKRPHAEVENLPDFEHETFEAFAEIPTDTRAARDAARSTFGSKTVGLAVLWRLVDPEHLTAGFGVPFHYYRAFMEDNTWEVDLGAGVQTASYAETITAWLADATFRSDALVRRDKLEALRIEMTTHGVVSPDLVASLRDRIVDDFGSEYVMVRLRSSSNAEDSLAFNGAGLYESRSGCAADSFAAAGATFSLCDSNKEPRPLEAALAEVWASLWKFGAFEERDYYQLDHSQVAMGATVSFRFEDELANGVAFTGNPRDAKNSSYLVNAQYGDTNVVSATPGETAELSYLVIVDGEVGTIDRVVASSLVPEGKQVVTDDQLRVLGGLMAELDVSYPRDIDVEGEMPMLDFEFKVDIAGDVILKQVRTFPGTDYASDPTCRE